MPARQLLQPFVPVLVIFSVLGLLFCGAIPAYAAAPVKSNPYNAGYGPPNCTWYAWQRLHDVTGIDAQFSSSAGGWAIAAQQSKSFWSERTGSYVSVQINPDTPAPGDIEVLPIPSFYARPYHVAFVESVELDTHGNFSGNYTVSEQSYGDWNAGWNTQPYPYTYHRRENWNTIQRAEGGQGLFVHFFQTPELARHSLLEVSDRLISTQNTDLTIKSDNADSDPGIQLTTLPSRSVRLAI